MNKYERKAATFTVDDMAEALKTADGQDLAALARHLDAMRANPESEAVWSVTLLQNVLYGK